MEQVVVTTGTGIIATDGAAYATLALLKAAGKTAFPGLEAQGLYPSSLVFTSLNAAEAAAGDIFTFRTNETTAPSVGVPVQGAGQQFVVPGISSVNRYMISNTWIVSKQTAGDHVKISALYD